MTEIERGLGELNAQIKSINGELRTAQNETRKLDKDLRMDSGNVTAMKEKLSAMSRAVELNVKKVAALKDKQAQLAAAYNNGEISLTKYDSQLASTNKQLAAAEKQLAEMNATLKNQDAFIAISKLDNLTGKLNKVQAAAKTVSRAVLGVTAAMGAMVMAAVAVEDNLDDTSRKWQISAEQLQINNNLYDKITEAPKGYEDALSSLGSVMSSIARGRGAAYINVLKKMGIAEEELAGLNTAQLYDKVYEALRNVDDETQRAVLAQQLMGESGLNVALVAGTSAEQIAALNAELAKNGIISSEQAASGGQISDTLANIKTQALSAFASLATAIYPMLKIIFNFLQETVLPVLKNIFEWFGNMNPAGQKFILILALVAVFLPKIIGIVNLGITIFKKLKAATLAQAAATGTLSTAALPLTPIFLAVAAALLVVITLLSVFSSKADAAANSVQGLMASSADLNGIYANMSADVTQSAYTMAETKNTTTSNINLDVHTSGDTPIDEKNALLIDEALADTLNKILGGKT